MSSKRRPFPEVEAERPDFDAADQWNTTKAPGQPGWKAGSGANNNQALPGVKEGLWKANSEFKQIDPSGGVQKGLLYRMMISSVVPRPVAFVSSVDNEGNQNLAPFSYFNIVGHDPPMLMVSFTHPAALQTVTSDQNVHFEGATSPDKLKDTCKNILETKKFAVNIISEPFLEAANYTSIDMPPEVSEWPVSGLTQVEAKLGGPPLVGESAFKMECELEHHYHMINDDGQRTGTVVLGRIRLFHCRKDLIDEESLIVDSDKLQPISRLGGITYGRTTSVYELPRPSWKEEKETSEVKAALAKGPNKL